jgi:hypothetical protein
MNHAFFDSTLKFNWDMIPADRSFDTDKVEDYLSKLTESDRSFIKELLNKKTYIKYPEFKQALLQSFELFRQNIGQQDFYLMLSTDKISSEHWTVTLLWSQLRTLNLKQIINDTSELPLEDVTNILIVDDVIYSGNNTLAKIDNFIYRLAQSLSIKQSEVGKYFKFHITIPFITSGGYNSVLKFCKNRNIVCTIYGIHYLSELTLLMDIESYYKHELSTNPPKLQNIGDLLYYKFGIECIDMPPIYLDHKVAGAMSTFNTIYDKGRLPPRDNSVHATLYGSLFKNNPSREKIEELAQLYNTYSLMKNN